MHFKLILACVEDQATQAVLDAARKAGATGSTIIGQARGEGLEKTRTFFGLALEAQRDVILLLVEEHLSRHILETIAEVAGFKSKPGSGIAFQVDVEDAVGIDHQVRRLSGRVEEEI
ncbi:P-II family nitrogen regulator [Methyloparacoccus murrellii]